MTRPGDEAPRLVRLLVRAERVISVLLLAMILALITAQVVARYVFASPITWSEELARFTLIWLAFVAAAFVMADGRHIAVDVITRPMGPRHKVAVEALVVLIVAVTCLLLLPASLEFVQGMATVRSPGMGIPMNLWYLAAFTGFVLLVFHACVNVVVAFSSGRPVWDRAPEEPDEALPGSGAWGPGPRGRNREGRRRGPRPGKPGAWRGAGS
jgi:TRAP-type transport system small permease protein